MRAILVDPFKRVVRDVYDNFNDAKVIGQYLAQGDLGDRRAPFSMGPRLAEHVHTYVDDEGFYRPEQAWFLLSGYPSPLAGYMLVLADNGRGDEAGLQEGVDASVLQPAITWITEAEAAPLIPPITISGMDGVVIESIPIDITDKRPLGESRHG